MGSNQTNSSLLTDTDEISFGEFRGRWLDQVNDDPELAGASFQVAYCIARHLNRKDRTTFVGNKVLASESHVTDRTVRTALRLLESRGHLEITQPAGNAKNVLRPLLRRKAFPPEAEVKAPQAEVISGSGGNGFRASHVDSNTSAPNLLSLTLISNPLTPPEAAVTDEDFNELVTHYPKRNVPYSTKPVRVEFESAVSKGTPARVIIDAVKHYASDMERIGKVGTEFVKSPVNWLREEGWSAYASTAPKSTLITIMPGTPQWDAWHTHFTAHGKRNYIRAMEKFRDAGKPYAFDSEWPTPPLQQAA